ncbi:MAG TPA: NAD(P)(+) transhydrogenase (Re/Si-specific) subunit beta [Phycisphaerae bacterium]|nr:NAD(P)(+) transhydrogenase (Re/Si-specific) subunit beta [Phycisphaerae bacterium]HOM50106.1 NAD(P)(+) transhydrogenase (Re/Si-specific) subunit beta [Phycisphaerae bacterium]HPP26591.1 NAD(P)(+) transhydrogenase (Re/Si-specific) subunit beta [Phycisphaerae bacterium]
MAHKWVDLAIVILLMIGISWFRNPKAARKGNAAAALALAVAIIVVLVRFPVQPVSLVVIFAALGAVTGWGLARSVNMVQIPAMVAVQNGMGGLASFLVAGVELTRAAGGPLPAANSLAGLLGVAVGTVTFSGSMVAAGKLANRIRQTPVKVPGHNAILSTLSAAAVVLIVIALRLDHTTTSRLSIAILVGLTAAVGILFSLRVGGADMPVLISFLNSASGLAAALCGMAIGNWLLIACGAIVGVSGTLLTLVMCQAMNRSLRAILVGREAAPAAATPSSVPAPATVTADAAATAPESATASTVSVTDGPEVENVSAATADPFESAVAALTGAQRVIIIPGYGMALADAQEEVVGLSDKLVEAGKDVIFAIHPVAGRMPGHMHVLLAEADVDYTRIRELKDVNPLFSETDVALIVGACDVVNPAAIAATGTPISGMPILRADEARTVIVCNLDDKPGYSGVENPLYRDPRTLMLLGDAKDTVSRLLEQLSAAR